jgi:hypothetical protein
VSSLALRFSEEAVLPISKKSKLQGDVGIQSPKVSEKLLNSQT